MRVNTEDLLSIYFAFWNFCLSPPQFVLLLVQSLIDNNSSNIEPKSLSRLVDIRILSVYIGNQAGYTCAE